ncbi:MAG: hypothetical protein ACOYL6_11225 [Bacteriovoracaceae bacterium]
MAYRIGVLGAGWVGIPLCDHLHKCGYQVRLITTKELSSIDWNQFNLLISTWPRQNSKAFETLPSNIPLIALGTINREQPILDFEQFLQNHFPHLTLLRLGGLIGYNRHPGKFLSGKKDLLGKNHATNLIHRDDVMQIILELIQLAEIPVGSFDLVCDEHPSKEAFYSLASSNLNLPLPKFKLDDVSQKKAISNQKIKDLLHYTFLFPSPLDYLQVLRERKNNHT